MEWLERFDTAGEFPKPIFINKFGNRRTGQLDDIRRTHGRRGYGIVRIPDIDLKEFRLCASETYLAAIGIRTPHRDSHSCFKLEYQNRQIVIPAAILMASLITDLSAIGEKLLCAGGLNEVAAPLVDNDQVLLKFGKRIIYRRKTFKEENVFSRYEWLTCFPSARRMWGSVYSYASTGRMHLDLPSARVDVSISGFSSKGIVYATKIRISKIFPNEPPLAMAIGLTREVYVINRGTDVTSAQELWKHRKPRQVDKSLKEKISFPQGAQGWQVTPAEWKEIQTNLERAGFTANERSRDSINLAIEKLVCGHTWKSIGAHWRAAEVIFRKWASNGRWKVLETTLQELRDDKSLRQRLSRSERQLGSRAACK